MNKNPYVVRVQKARPVVPINDDGTPVPVMNQDGEPVPVPSVSLQYREILFTAFVQYAYDIMKTEKLKIEVCDVDVELNPDYDVEKSRGTRFLKSYKDAFDKMIDSIPIEYRAEVVCTVQNIILRTTNEIAAYWPVVDMEAGKTPWPDLSKLKVMMLVCLMVEVQYQCDQPEGQYDSAETVGGAEEEED